VESVLLPEAVGHQTARKGLVRACLGLRLRGSVRMHVAKTGQTVSAHTACLYLVINADVSTANAVMIHGYIWERLVCCCQHGHAAA
jgi:hypothetical protein